MSALGGSCMLDLLEIKPDGDGLWRGGRGGGGGGE